MKNNGLPIALLERHELIDDVPTDDDISRMMAEIPQDPLDPFFEEVNYCPPSVSRLRQEKLDRVQKARLAKDATQNPLRAALRKAGVKPFTPESVEKYKKESIRNKFQIFTTDVNSPEAPFVFLAICGLIASALIYSIVGSILTIVFSLSVPLTIPFAIGLTVALFILGLVCAQSFDTLIPLYLSLGPIIFLFEKLGPSQYVWVTKPIAEYEKDIPRTVLETAQEINFHCKDARFFIEEIDKKPDPFLVVMCLDERFYVDVWAEPDFKGDRLV